MSRVHPQNSRLGQHSLEVAGKEDAVGGGIEGGRILPGETDAEDSLLMGCRRRLAEGALSKGSRCSQTGPLSAQRTVTSCGMHTCPLPGPPRHTTAFGEPGK